MLAARGATASSGERDDGKFHILDPENGRGWRHGGFSAAVRHVRNLCPE